jgi:DNA repair exonuclease SbcCD ATPase subunit
LGVLLLDLIPKIYDAPRVARIVHEDFSHDTVQLQPGAQPDPINKIYDITTGKYDVVVQTGPSFNTKRQETAQSMSEIIQAFPQLMQVAGDLLVKNLDWPGAEDLAARLAKTLPPQLQDDPENNPAMMGQKLQESQQMIEQLTKALNETHDELTDKEAELASRERIATQNNEVALVIAELKAQGANNLALFKEELAHIRHDKQMLAQQQSQEAAREQAEMQQPEPQSQGGT